MIIAEGRGAWWNSYGSVPLDKCVQRAVDAKLRFVIVKWGRPDVETAFTKADSPFLVERYVLYSQPEVEGQRLANAVDVGAVAAVINAEEGGDEQSGGHWERDTDGSAMRRLIAAFRIRHPTVELYASVDTRGNRLSLPYQRVLAQHIAGWLPMIYPLAFYPDRLPGFIAHAFEQSLDGKDFGGIPVLPTIQTYDAIGGQAVRDQLAEIERRHLPGCQAYTIAHATDEEWAEFILGDDDMTAAERQELAVLRMLRDLEKVLAASDLQLLSNKLAAIGVRPTV